MILREGDKRLFLIIVTDTAPLPSLLSDTAVGVGVVVVVVVRGGGGGGGGEWWWWWGWGGVASNNAEARLDCRDRHRCIDHGHLIY